MVEHEQVKTLAANGMIMNPFRQLMLQFNGLVFVHSSLLTNNWQDGFIAAIVITIIFHCSSRCLDLLLVFSCLGNHFFQLRQSRWSQPTPILKIPIQLTEIGLFAWL